MLGLVWYGLPLIPKPVTRTEVALAVDQVSDTVPPMLRVEGAALIEAVTLAPAFTVTVAVRVMGPPLPCAVSVKVWVPEGRPVIDWEPVAAVLAMPVPVTKTDVALVVVHDNVVAPGAVVVVGLAASDAVTVGAAGETVNVVVRVTGPPDP